MYKRILLATDGSALAGHAVSYGIKLAQSVGASVVGMYASPPFEIPVGFEFVPAPFLPVDVYEKSAKTAAKKYLAAIETAASKAGVACKVKHVSSLSPADAIISTAQETKCDLIVLGSHGRGSFRAMFLGSVTTRVLALCTLPVLVHRDAKAKAKT
jgi:nucleotide-binding universal stress UspA family protein